MSKPYTISQLIEALQKVKKEHGDLPVYYASSYDWVLPICENEIAEDMNWDNEPKGKYLALE